MVDGEMGLILTSLAAIMLMAGFVHSAIGFGYGIVALAVVPFVIDIRSAHVVISMSSVPMLMMAGWSYRRGTDWPTLRTTVFGAAVFLPIGLWAFAVAPLDWLVRGTGLAILMMALLSFGKQRSSRDPVISKRSCFVAGAISGFLAGAVSIAGPPVAAFALKQQWSQDRFKSFVTLCLLVIATGKAVLLLVSGYVTAISASYTLIAAPFAIVGVQLGVRASRHIPARQFKRIVAIALILISCLMLWRGSPSV